MAVIASVASLCPVSFLLASAKASTVSYAQGITPPPESASAVSAALSLPSPAYLCGKCRILPWWVLLPKELNATGHFQ